MLYEIKLDLHQICRWAKLVYPLLLHGAVRLRERAMVAMEIGMAAMLEHREELVKHLVTDLRAVSHNLSAKLVVTISV